MGFEYKTLNKPFVSILGLVTKKLMRKKPPNITKIIKSGKLRPISENDNKKKYIFDSNN